MPLLVHILAILLRANLVITESEKYYKFTRVVYTSPIYTVKII